MSDRSTSCYILCFSVADYKNDASLCKAYFNHKIVSRVCADIFLFFINYIHCHITYELIIFKKGSNNK